MPKKLRPHIGKYQLIFKKEVIAEAPDVKEACRLLNLYNKKLNTNSIKLNFKYQ
jgi:hypothetical protein